jgi:hypothetical protein
MDPAYASAIAALAGSAIGGLTSLGTTLLTHRAQTLTEHRARDKQRRQDLYKEFIEEASRLYGEGLSKDKTEVTNLVGIYAKISRMRILSSETVIMAAERVASAIVDAYLGPNHTIADIRSLIDSEMDPLKDFGEACRKELRAQGYL